MAVPPLNLAELEAEVTRDDSVTSGAETVISTLINEIAAANAQATGNQAAVDAVLARYRPITDRLAAAIAAVPPAPPV